MDDRQDPRSPVAREIVISLPFTGRCLVENSPARRVPSDGTNLLGGRYAIDFVGVDHRHRTADRRDWRTLLSTEPVERFLPSADPSWPRLMAWSSRSTMARSITGHDDRSQLTSGTGVCRDWPRS